MTNDASSTDFRGKRYKLPPEAFAIGPAHEPPPSDLIDRETWLAVVHLPDDVSFRTSDHHGTLVKQAYETWGMWVSLQLDVQATFEPLDGFSEDVLQVSCLNVTDELEASLYFMLTGFYRQAISVLRSALDGVVAGAFFRARPDRVRATQWLEGHRDGGLRFQDLRRALGVVEPYSRFTSGAELIGLTGDQGWINFLHGALSGFSHGRPFFVNKWGNRIPTTNLELWSGSNGPVYRSHSVRLWSHYYFDTALLCLMLLGLADQRLPRLPRYEDVAYADFLHRVADWHPGPPQVAGKIMDFLDDGLH